MSRFGTPKVPLTTQILFFDKDDSLGLIENEISADSGSSILLRDETAEKYRLSPEAREVLRRLDTFKRLPENWDGEGAIRPSERAIRNAILFLEKTEEISLPVFFAAPGPDGEILLEYKDGEHSAEVYFDTDNSSEMILYESKRQVFDGGADFERLANFF